MKTVTVAMIGSGVAANLHCNAYKKVGGINVRLKTLVDIDLAKGRAMAEQFGFEQVVDDIGIALADAEIDVVDIAVHPNLHMDFIAKAMQAGKHVICEKPLTGYCGQKGDAEPVGLKVDKRAMFDFIRGQCDAARSVVQKYGKLFMYAENYVYSPSVVRAVESLTRKKSKIIFIKGVDNQRGSASPMAGHWNIVGGGSLMRHGCHVVAAMLSLKQAESAATGRKISVKSVFADTHMFAPDMNDDERRHMNSKPIDVEDMATVGIRFSDGTGAVVIANDHMLGGVQNYLEINANDSAFRCNITTADNLKAYMADDRGFEEEKISENMVEKLGWNNWFVVDEILRGYTAELQDFMECVAFGRQPVSGLELACDTVQVVYAAYLSSQEGRRIDF